MVGTLASLRSVRGPMTRLVFALSIAIFALAFSACEKHPLPGETAVTFTHGSNGGEPEHEAEKKPETTAATVDKKEEKGGAPEEKKH